jgi:hypothetical protein
LDVLVLASSIIKNDVEEDSSPTYSKNTLTNLKKETMNLKETTPTITPQFATSSNELNDMPMAPNLALPLFFALGTHQIKAIPIIFYV